MCEIRQHESTPLCVCLYMCVRKLTRIIRRIAATPDVAMTLALLGTRLSNVGIIDSAPWSNLLPRTEDKCLKEEK